MKHVIQSRDDDVDGALLVEILRRSESYDATRSVNLASLPRTTPGPSAPRIRGAGISETSAS